MQVRSERAGGGDAAWSPADGAPAWLSRPVSTERCHVTIRAGRRRVDLSLPGEVPVLEFTPMLAALCEAGAGTHPASGSREATPPVWSLARAGGRPLPLTGTLAEAGVLDGEVLQLVDVAAWGAPAVSDVADVVGAVLEAGGRWTAAVRAGLLGGLAALCLVAAAAVAAGSGAVDRTGGVLALAVAVLLALPARGVPAVLEHRGARLGLAVGAVAFAALAGWGLAGAPAGPAGIAAAAAGAAAGLAAAWPLAPAVAPGAVLAAGVLAVAALAAALGAAPVPVEAAVTAAGLVAIRLWPAVVGRALDAAGGEDPREAAAAALRFRRLLTSLSAATALVVLVSALALAGTGGGFALGLAAVAGAALLLRARAYRRVPEALPPALAGGLVLLAVALAAVSRPLLAQGRALPAAAALALAGAGLAALSIVRGSLAPPAWATRWAWLAADVALIPLLLGALGVFDLAGQLIHHFVH